MPLMQQLIEAEKACCIFGYFIEKRDLGTKALADHLGVTDRTIRLWKARIRKGETLAYEREKLPASGVPTAAMELLPPQHQPQERLALHHAELAFHASLPTHRLPSSSVP